ncbi:polysaccharide deacetylase [Isachenkonia alkalipeptolytica]|uniref:Polysaccharide deacetylase n=2 Tax=Isachenkonia alkalipeptolytica TaxID=2565777 RepID=A0AA44BG40_9CLOT|nr:polysaccharide deacetylase [Isachenkonia alkalipeptolytica]
MLLTLLLLVACDGDAEEDESLEDQEVLEQEQSPEEEASQDEASDLPEDEEAIEEEEEGEGEEGEKEPDEKTAALSLEEIQERYQDQEPKEWGESVTGVNSRIDTEDRVIALTFDACGGAYDQALIQYLKEQEIPATLFISGEWIDNHPDTLVALGENPNFDIANHGKHHKPLSVQGKSAYGIPGTESIEGVYEEVYGNHLKIKGLTGHRSQFFRSGTAYYDEVAVKIVEDLGEIAVNYNVLGDAGATFTANQIYESMIQAKSGSIMLFHMNHPDSDIAEGVKLGVEALREDGFEFVLLKDYRDQLQ